MSEDETCAACGQMHWSAYVKLSADERAKTSACPGHSNKPELVTLPPGIQVFPKNYFYDEKEALWEIVQTVAQEDSTYYEDNDGYMHCSFCTAQTSSFIHEFPHQSDCIIMKARELLKQRELQPRVELKIHDASDEMTVVNSVLHWKELINQRDGGQE